VLDQEVGQAKEVKQLDADGTVKYKDMAFKLKNKELKKIVGQLKNSATMHAKQAKKLESMNNSPMKKISGPCKAAAKRKFKVWPSAYASGWGVRCTRAGGPGSMGKSKKK
jgi:uncharacterized phage infection (PIP) family protein YhgE